MVKKAKAWEQGRAFVKYAELVSWPLCICPGAARQIELPEWSSIILVIPLRGRKCTCLRREYH